MFRKIFYFLITIVIIFIVAIFFSEKTIKYECIGKFKNTNMETSIFLKHSEYRWWIKLWWESDGMMWIEVPNKTVDVSTELREVGNLIQLLGFKKELKGIFSPLSKSISVKIDDDFYDGSCKEIK